MMKREKRGRAFHFVGTFTRKKDAVACVKSWHKKGHKAQRHLKGKVWHVFRD